VLQAKSSGPDWPTLDDFFPPDFIGGGGLLPLNRVGLVRLVAIIILAVLLILGARSLKVVPTRASGIFEYCVNFVKKQIADEILGEEAGRRYLPLIATIFFTVLALNITGVIPFFNVSSNGVVAMPLVLAIIAWVAFIVAGIRAHGAGHYFKAALFPAGAPKLLYIILTPIEFISTFVLRPFTLTIRLMANMISGHFLLAAFYVMTEYLLLHAAAALKGVAVVSFAAVIAFTAFEIFVAALQAYIFALLTSVYISLALEEH
jgi:F-type H+-transporting ATPase subunit a